LFEGKDYFAYRFVEGIFIRDFIKKADKKRIKKGLLPANFLLTRGAAELKETPTFKKRFGLKPCCIAGGALYKGVASILGMDLIKIKRATGFVNTDLKEKISVAKKSLNKYNFVFLHIKAADSLGEDGNFKGKKKFIEKIDKNFYPLLNLNNITLVVTGDHSTCSLMKKHCNRPIPILIYNGKNKDGIKKFSEKNCRQGSLKKIKQIDLMKKILARK
jgi:2,3-bisphosphoglycerate-independent phosphoglycerate mutase